MPPPRERGVGVAEYPAGVLVGRGRIGDAQRGEGGGKRADEVARQCEGLVGVGEGPRLKHAPSQLLELPHGGCQLSWRAHGKCQGMPIERRRLEGTGGLQRRGWHERAWDAGHTQVRGSPER